MQNALQNMKIVKIKKYFTESELGSGTGDY